MNAPLQIPLRKHNISEDAQNFLFCLLEKDDKKRITVEEALNHVWIRDVEISHQKPKIVKEMSFKKSIKDRHMELKEKETSDSFDNLFKFIKTINKSN